jgi:hypothetical protein
MTLLAPLETTTATTNIFEAVLGRKAVKWDAFWHLFEWLLNAEEGHGLGDSIRVQLIAFAFGQTYADCVMKREHPVSGQTDGKGKWADFALGIPTLKNPTHLIIMDDIGAAASGGMRKLQNLADYISLSQQAHPNATIRAIPVSDAPTGTKLAAAVYKTLGEEAAEFIAVTGWKLLPLQTIGAWIQDAIDGRRESLSDKMTFVLEDLVEWCR